MKVTILGGTGFVGRYLTNKLQAQGASVKSYGRHAFVSETSLLEAIDDTEVLVILVGENIGQRWSETYKKALFDSRIKNNEKISQVLKQCKNPPKKIFSASAIGIYPERYCGDPVDESCVEVGEGFLGQLGSAWEDSAKKLTPQPVIMRFGVVLGTDGGALEKMLLPFKLGFGGPVAGGKQCFSWVHIQDLVDGIGFLIENSSAGETYNICSPSPLSNAEFGKALAQQLKRPFLIPLPEWQLKLMFGEGAQVLTHSSAVLPNKITKLGFEFTYPTAESALQNLLK